MSMDSKAEGVAEKANKVVVTSYVNKISEIFMPVTSKQLILDILYRRLHSVEESMEKLLEVKRTSTTDDMSSEWYIAYELNKIYYKKIMDSIKFTVNSVLTSEL